MAQPQLTSPRMRVPREGEREDGTIANAYAALPALVPLYPRTAVSRGQSVPASAVLTVNTLNSVQLGTFASVTFMQGL